MNNRRLLQFLLLSGICLFSFSSFAQPAFTLTNKKDACDGLANGQITVTVTSATGTIFGFLVSSGPAIPFSPTVGVPMDLTGLVGTIAGKSYTVLLTDDLDNSAQFFTVFSVTAAITVFNQIGFPIDNNNCVSPTGQIKITALGGSGFANLTYLWTGPNGYTSTSQDISGLAGGTYTVRVSDSQTICYVDFPVVITDPRPNDRPITNDGNQSVCFGDSFGVLVGNSENNVTYEVFRCVGGDCNNLQTTGASATSGSNGSTVNITVPNAGTTFVSGDILKVKAILGNCSPIFLSDQINITVKPKPQITNSSLTQNICSNGTASLAITSDQVGTTYAWTSSFTGTLTGVAASGTGNISDANIVNSGITAGTVTYVITPTFNGCPGTPVNFVVTVQPNATITNVTLTDDVCSNETVTFTPTSNVVGATFSWTASASTGNITGFDASGTGAINDAGIVNAGLVSGTVTYVITPIATGCNGTPANFVVTVQPSVAVTNNPLTQNICSNGTASLTITSNIAGATFNWTAAASNGNITGFFANGTGNISDANILNSGIVSGTVTYTITPTANGCNGTPVDFVVTVQPNVAVTNTPLTQNICHNGTASLTITSNIAGATFAWTAAASNGNITGFIANGTGNINDANILNSGIVSGTVTYTITPTANGCPGVPSDYVVTVQPNATITNATLTDDICSNETVTFTPTSNIGGATFSWTASSSTGNITGFDASGTGAINDAGIVNSGIVSGTVTYVITPIANGCNGTPSNFVVTVQPNVAITNTPLTQNICNNGTANLTITSNIAGATFAWTAVASNGNITGFIANGTGNINDANILNSGIVSGTVTYTITPTANGCPGAPADYVVTVQPNATITNATLTDDICSNETVTFTPTSNVGGATFSWTASASNGNITGFDASGTGAISDAGIINNGVVSGTVTYVITPIANGCNGTPANFVVTVQPNVAVTNAPLTQNICSNGTASLTITSNIGGATFSWTAVASNGNITGFDANGTGNINDANIVNSGIVSGTVTYTITPTANGCAGAPSDYVVTVQPNATITNVTLTDDICSNETVTFTPTSNIGGATFGWSTVASNGNITGFDALGTGNINDANIVNSGIVAGTVTYTITPIANGCAGVPSDFVVTVQPNATITNVTLTDDICSNETVTFTPTSNIGGATFNWTASASNVNITGFDLSGTGAINDAGILNVGLVAGTVTYVITPVSNGCNGTPSNFVVTVEPNVAVTNSPLTQNICNNGTASLTITSNVAGATFGWTAVASNGNITGFDALGTGNINDANIVNSGIVAGTVTYTIIPIANGCAGAPSDYVVTVQPNATITNATLTDDICSNETVTFTPTSNIGGATFSWTASASNGNITGFDISGTGAISDAGIVNAGIVSGTVTYVITPIANGCNGTPANFVVTVQPNVSVTNTPLTQNICSNGTATLTITSNIAGATFGWTAVASNGNITGFDALGTGNINDANILNSGIVAGTVTYTITPTANGCAGAPSDYVVTVQPNATITNATLTDDICNNETVTFTPTSNIGGATFSWTASASNGNITGFDVSGTGAINDSGIMNAGIVSGTVTYVITPIANGCNGTPSNFVVTVQPNVTVTNTPLTQNICNDGTASLTITSSIGGATFSWTAVASNGNITGFDANGTGNINDANILNSGIVSGTVTYTITPTANGCAGTPSDYVVTVQPNAIITNATLIDDICSSETVTFTPTSNIGGATFSWTASASNGNITGFDVSGTGAINDAGIMNAGSVSGTVTYVITPIANGCNGTPSNLVVTVQPNATITNVTLTDDICSNETLSFTPTSNVGGVTFSWTASTSDPITGFDVSGTGAINDAGIVNSGLVSGTVTYVITPVANGCNGTPANLVITVQPNVAITNTPLTQNICSNGTASLTITSDTGGATFSWTAVASSGDITGFDANGTGNISDANILNSGIVAGTVTYTITASANGCAGVPSDYVVTVQPNATITNATLTDDICSNETLSFTPTSNIGGATFSWTASTSDPITGFDASGTGAITDAGIVNSGLVSGTVTYVITPIANGCNGTPANLVVTVQPNATITNATLTNEICSNETLSFTPTSNIGGATFSWTASTSDPITGFDASGTGAISDAGIVNNGTVAGVVTYVITPIVNGCNGTPANLVVTVYPAATASAGSIQTVCASDVVQLAGTIGGAATSSLWSTSGDGTFDNAVLANAKYTPGPNDITNGSVTLTIETDDPTGPCVEVNSSIIITIISGPNIGLTVSVSTNPLCSGGITDITVANSQIGVNYQLRNDDDNTLIGSPVPGTGNTIALSSGVLNADATFNIFAGIGTCGLQLTNKAIVSVTGSVNQALAVTAAATPICTGTGTLIQVTGSENGVTYQLRNNLNDLDIGTPVPGNGGTIDLPTLTLTATTDFNVFASNGVCSIELTDIETVNVDQIPTQSLTVTVMNDPLCEGTSTDIEIQNSEAGVSYQLRDNSNINIGSPVAGTSGTINLNTGNLFTTTTFNILATGAAGCSPVELTTKPIVNVVGTINAALITTAVSPTVCLNTSTDIQLANSEVGVNYQLRDDSDNSNVGSIMPGTGLTISFPTGNLAVNTTFHVLADNGSCSIILTDKETVTVTTLPNAGLTVTASPATVCFGTSSSIIIAASEVGVNYQLRDHSNNATIGSPVVGTGNNINISLSNMTATTTYNVLASVGTCSVQLTQTVIVNVLPALDPACVSVGTDCFAFTVVPDLSVIQRPSCSNQDDGVYAADITGNPGYTGKLDVSIWLSGVRIDGYIDYARKFTFSALSPGSYELRLEDQNGNLCVKPFELKVETTVTATASTVSDTQCFNQPEGVASLVITGGNSPYEYSLDGGANFVSSYVSGNNISGLAVGSYNILVRDDNLDACPAEVAITIGNQNPEIEYFVAVANETECSAGDGELRVTGINGGFGDKQIRLFRIENSGPVLQVDYAAVTSTDYTFVNLLSGTYYIELQDASGCTVDNSASAGTITSPGGIDFTVRVIASAECGENAGKNGVIGISFDPSTSSGAYKIGVSTSSLIEPANYGDYFYTQGQVDEILIDTLSRGNFFVFVKPTGNTVCPSFEPTGPLDGPYVVDFDVQRVCGLSDGSTAVNLVNVIGDPLVSTYNIEVYNMADLAVKVDDFSLDKVNEILTITYVPTGSGEHVWLNSPNDYLIRVYQANQLYCLGERPFRTPSHDEVYAVRESIALTIGTIKPSLPEPRQTGSFVLSTVTGGVPFPDEEGPYYNVSVYDPTNEVELFGPIKVRRNSQGRYEHEFRNIPTANYRVEVTDSFGCAISAIVIVPADTRLLIPNIFTPNGDAVNDEFEVLNLPDGEHKLVITNRWGRPMFESNSYKEGSFWSGDDAPEGIYFYKLDIAGDQLYSGWVELRRGSKP